MASRSLRGRSPTQGSPILLIHVHKLIALDAPARRAIVRFKEPHDRRADVHASVVLSAPPREPGRPYSIRSPPTPTDHGQGATGLHASDADTDIRLAEAGSRTVIRVEAQGPAHPAVHIGMVVPAGNPSR